MHNVFFLLLHIPVTFSSTSGHIFEKADITADCCEANSISSSITGTQYGWPTVYPKADSDCALQCGGGQRKTLQGWLDHAAATRYKGLCIDGFLYTVVKGGIIFSLK